MTQCSAINGDGLPCQQTLGLMDGLCVAHREGGRERLAAIASLGGTAAQAKLASAPLEEKDLRAITSTDDAKAALVDIRNFVATRRLTHSEGNAMTKAIEGWLKADAAGITRVVTEELKDKLASLEQECKSLKTQLAAAQRGMRVA